MAPTKTKKPTKSNPFDLDIPLRAHNKKVITKKTAIKQDREKAAKEELANLSDHFKQIKAMDKRAKLQAEDTMDSEFWIAICFQSRAQKEEFLRKAKLPKTIGDKYLNGMTVAKIMGIPLETDVPPIRKHKGVEKKLSSLSMDYTQVKK